VEKMRDRRPRAAGRFLCGPLWFFVPSVLSFSEFNTESAEQPALLRGKREAVHCF
jgi:hypothetical protein